MWLLLLFADDEEFQNFENEIFESYVAVLLIFVFVEIYNNRENVSNKTCRHKAHEYNMKCP